MPSPLRPCFVGVLLTAMVYSTGVSRAQAPQLSDRPAVYRTEVIAGTREIGDGGPAAHAVLAGVGGILATRDTLYIADTGQNRVRAVDLKRGVIRTIAGSGLIDDARTSGPATAIPLLAPGPLALDPTSRTLYVGEVPRGRVIAVNLGDGTVSPLPVPSGGLRQPTGLLWTADGLIVLDSLTGVVWLYSAGSWRQQLPGVRLGGGLRAAARRGDGPLFISEFFGRRIVQVAPGAQAPTVIAQSATRTGGSVSTSIGTPDGLALDSSGRLHFADVGKSRVCRISTSGAIEALHVSPAAGDGAWTPSAIAFDQDDRLYVADVRRRRVLRFAAPGARPVTIAGTDANGDGGLAIAASLGHPGRVAVDKDGHIYISDALQHRIRRVDARTQRISTIAGSGVPGYNGDNVPGVLAQLNHPAGLLVADDVLYVADYYNHRLRAIDLKTGLIRTAAGSGAAADPVDAGPAHRTPLLNPHAIAIDHRGGLLITSAVSSSVARFDQTVGTLTPLRLTGSALPANRVLVFYGIASARGAVYLADGMRSSLLRVDDGVVTRLPGAASLNYPMDVAASESGDVYVCDTRNNRIVKWTDGRLTTIATGLGRPRGLALTADGDVIVADTFHNRVVRMRMVEGRRAAR